MKDSDAMREEIKEECAINMEKEINQPNVNQSSICKRYMPNGIGDIKNAISPKDREDTYRLM